MCWLRNNNTINECYTYYNSVIISIIYVPKMSHKHVIQENDAAFCMVSDARRLQRTES